MYVGHLKRLFLLEKMGLNVGIKAYWHTNIFLLFEFEKQYNTKKEQTTLTMIIYLKIDHLDYIFVFVENI